MADAGLLISTLSAGYPSSSRGRFRNFQLTIGEYIKVSEGEPDCDKSCRYFFRFFLCAFPEI